MQMDQSSGAAIVVNGFFSLFSNKFHRFNKLNQFKWSAFIFGGLVSDSDFGFSFKLIKIHLNLQFHLVCIRRTRVGLCVRMHQGRSNDRKFKTAAQELLFSRGSCCRFSLLWFISFIFSMFFYLNWVRYRQMWSVGFWWLFGVYFSCLVFAMASFFNAL